MARIRVKQIGTGQVGTISEENFDPAKYEMIGGANSTLNTSTNTPSPVGTGSTTGGLNLEKIIGMMALGNSSVLDDISKYKTALSLINPKKTSAQAQLDLQKTKGRTLNAQLDKLSKSWDKMSLLERIIPGAGRVSANRASYDTARDAYVLQLNNMVADKRISDKERDYYAKMFPQPLMTKSAAQARIDALKEFVNDYSNIVSPYTTQQNGLEDILSTLQNYQ